MNRVLELLQELSPADADWIFANGSELQVITEHVLVQEGKEPDALYFVLQGLVGVRHRSWGAKPVVTLGPGEIFGDMSFLEGLAPTTNVVAEENSLILALPRAALAEKLASDVPFSVRLYKAFAVMNSRRLRATFGAAGERLQDSAGVKDQAAGVVAQLAEQLTQFKELFSIADQEAIKNRGVVSEAISKQMQTAFASIVVRLNDLAGDASTLDPAVRDQIGRFAKREVLPYLLMTRNGERMYAKPRGYAGDYLTIEWMYENVATGTGRLGPLLDRCFLNEPAASAVQNRRGLLLEEILAKIEATPDRTTHVMSLACGPAREIFDAFEQLPDKNRLKATLVDIDLQALAFVEDRIAESNLRKQIKLVNGNLVYLAMGRQKLDAGPQDLVYSIGLIDYFNDAYVVKLLNYIHKLLVPGGRAILGNFHPKNTTKGLMDWVLDWRLIHRSEEDMNRLFEASAFAKPCSRIRFEASGVNLFAFCEKSVDA